MAFFDIKKWEGILYMENEMMIMELIVASGDARSSSIEAIRLARDGDIAGAKEKIVYAKNSIQQAHDAQTESIQKEIRGEKVPIDLLTVHAQDHLMNAMTILELSEEIIDILEIRGTV